jgi:hypothetical protein
LTTWSATRPIRRVFRLTYRATQFNPGGSGVRGRFHFFADAAGTVVPILYGAESEDAAIGETVLRDVDSGGVVLRPRLSDLALAVVIPLRDLSLIELYGHGLKRLRLGPHALTSTDPIEYPRTVAWAKALHTAAPGADGLVWMSHRFNTSAAVMLFGDRVAEASLSSSAPLPLSFGEGLNVVERSANEADITIL